MLGGVTGLCIHKKTQPTSMAASWEWERQGWPGGIWELARRLSFFFKKKGEKSKANMIEDLTVIYWGWLRRCLLYHVLSFIFLISQSENSPGCQATLVKRRPWPSCHGVCCPQRAVLRGAKAGKEGLKGHPPPAPTSFYIFRRTFHISTRSCKNLSWAVPLVNFTLWHTSELSGHTEVLLPSVPTYLTVSPETIP